VHCGNGPAAFNGDRYLDFRSCSGTSTSVAQMGKEQYEVRIWAGIHFRTRSKSATQWAGKIADHWWSKTISKADPAHCGRLAVMASTAIRNEASHHARIVLLFAVPRGCARADNEPLALRRSSSGWRRISLRSRRLCRRRNPATRPRSIALPGRPLPGFGC